MTYYCYYLVSVTVEPANIIILTCLLAASSDGPEMIRGLAPGPSFPLKPSFVGLYHFERD